MPTNNASFNQAWLASIVESSNDAIFSKTPDGIILTWNRGAEALYGYSAAEAIGQSFAFLVPDEHQSEIALIVASIRRGERMVGHETVRQHKNGSLIDVSLTVSPIFDGDGLVCGASAIARDISAQKRAREALERSEKRYQALVSNFPNGSVYLIDLEARILLVHGRGMVKIGLSQAVVGHSLHEVFGEHPVYEAIFDAYQRALCGEEVTFEGEIKGRCGVVRMVPVRDDADEISCVMAMTQDTTDEKQAQDALRRSEERFRAFLDNIPAVVFIKDEDGRYVYLNKGVETLVQTPVARLLGKTVFERMPQTIAQPLRENCLRVLSSGQAMEFEETVPAADGSMRQQLVTKFPITDNDGRRLVAGVAIDITERKRAEEALRDSEEFCRAVTNSLMAHIAVLDSAGTITAVNEAWERFRIENNGLNARKMGVGVNYLETCLHSSGDGAKAAYDGIKSVLEGHEASFTLEYPCHAPQEKRWFLMTVTPLKTTQGGAVVSHLNITKRKLAEDALRESQQSLARAQSIAHLGYTVVDARTHKVRWSDETYRILGFEADSEEKTPQQYYDAVHPDDFEAFIQPVKELLEQAKPSQVEYRIVRPSGEIRWVESRREVVTDDNGKPVRFDSILLDITERKLAEEELRKQTALLEAQMNASLDGILVVNLQNKKTIVNARFVEIWQVPQHIIEDEDDESQLQFVVNQVKNSQAFLERVRYLYAHPDEISRDEIELQDGRCLDRYSAPVLDKDGKNYGRIWTFRDVTERKRAEIEIHESRARLAGVVKSAMDAIISIDFEQRIVLFNPAAEIMFGYSSSEVLGQAVDIVIPERFRDLHRVFVEEFGQTGQTNRKVGTLGTICGVRATGEEFPIEAAISQIQLNGQKFYTVILRDITERERAEAEVLRSREALQHAYDNLEGRVAERTAQLNEANRLLRSEVVERQMALGTLRYVVTQLENSRDDAETARESAEAARQEADRANAAKSEFLSRMSHELRTPMNSILGFAQLMEMHAVDEREIERVSYILKAGQHLLQLINEVLDVARVESGRLSLSPEPVHLGSALQMAVDLVRPLCQPQALRLVYEVNESCNLYVEADQQRLSQVFLNLLSNATKYNRPNGEVRVRCEALNGHVRVSITDTGYGIAPEYMPRLFLPFERLGAESSGVEGTGLGLALSKRLVEAMGGALGVESTPGQGSTFWLELSVVDGLRQELHDSAPLDAVRMTEKECTILYIEDNLSNVQVIEHVLDSYPNIRLVSAMQGQIGLDLARQYRPVLVLLDLHLPDMEGSEVLRRLLADPATASVPVVIISADATPNQIRRLMLAGASEYLTKPIDVRRFLEMLHDVLQRYET